MPIGWLRAYAAAYGKLRAEDTMREVIVAMAPSMRPESRSDLLRRLGRDAGTRPRKATAADLQAMGIRVSDG